MHIFNSNQIRNFYLTFYCKKSFICSIRKELNAKSTYLCSIRKYCIESTVLKNQALAKYFENFTREFAEHEGNRFRGMKRDEVTRKIQMVNKLLEEIRTAHASIRSLTELRSGNLDEGFMNSLDEECKENEKITMDAEEAIIKELMPLDERESCNSIILEITAGVGGQEAMLFAQDLHRMYCSYIDFKKWNYELTNYEETELGGIRQSSFSISGEQCYKLLRYEGGVHRVQRVPKTEKYSRMQTSTVSVAVYSQPSDIEVVINDKDLKIETKTSRGPGGQHVNKTQTGIRIHHFPSGIIVVCEVHKSQYQNRKLAMQKLRSKLYEIECEKMSSSIKTLRKYQMGSASRNEKVRTYNYPQDRITDHRFNKTIHNIERYFEGNEHFDNFLYSLLEVYYDQEKKQFLEGIQRVYS